MGVARVSACVNATPGGVDAEPRAHHLREHRLVPGAGRVAANREAGAAIGTDFHLGVLLRRAAGALEVEADAEPEQAPVRPRAFRARRVPVGVDGSQRLIQHAGEVAAVDLRPHRRLERQLVAAQDVAAAYVGRIEPKLARGRVDDLLHLQARLGPAGAAVGLDRRRVREHRA